MDAAAAIEAALAKVTAALPAGEPRPGQVEMALAVGRAISEKRHVVVQAGTGTGKSLGYLVPAIVLGVRCVVATATKALQDQLAGKDLPFLAEHLGAPFSYSVLKGRSNYLCAQKAVELGRREQGTLDLRSELSDNATREEVARILEWAQTSPTGDRAELDFEPAPRSWSAVSVGADECPGAARCPMGERCFAEDARTRAAQADVVVVNSHLYGVHVASGGFVLPDHDVVVFDEAHELEDVAARTLGLEIGGNRLRGLVRALRGLLTDPPDAGPLEESAAAFDRLLGPWRGRRVLDADRDALGEVVAAAVRRVESAVGSVRGLDPPDGTNASARKVRTMKAATSLLEDLKASVEADERHVLWVDGPDHAPVLQIATVDVGVVLASMLWRERVAVLTSATIPPFAPRRLGLPAGEFDQLDVGSPFDYRARSMLYVAAHLPDPRDPGYERAMHGELARLVRAAGGRTLALFTSWRAMHAAADALRGELPWRVLTQAELPKPALLREFTVDETSCLFATMGFWQGVDVPGASLSLVVLDRIPFPRPDDPLTQARRELAGPSAFATVDIPRAATLLAQGAGRLIRTATDRGVVAVLDPRLAKKDYRRQLLAPVPPMKRTVTFGDVEAFLTAASSTTAPPAAQEQLG